MSEKIYSWFMYIAGLITGFLFAFVGFLWK